MRATFGSRDRDAGRVDAADRRATAPALDPAERDDRPVLRAASSRDILYEQFGVDRALTGGLRVYTTLDADVQRFAEESVAKRLAELDKKPASRARRCRRRSSPSNRRPVTCAPWSAAATSPKARSTARPTPSASPAPPSSRSSSRRRSKPASRRARPSTASTATLPRRRAPTCPAASTRPIRPRCARRWCIRAIAPRCTCCSASASARPSTWPTASASTRCPRCRRWRSAPAKSACST